MGKSSKNFTEGLKSVFSSTTNEENKEPEQEKRKDAPKEGEDRFTFLIKNVLVDKIKDIAYWERQLLKETVEEAFQDLISKYEKKNGAIKPRPDEVRERENKRSSSGRPKSK